MLEIHCDKINKEIYAALFVTITFIRNTMTKDRLTRLAVLSIKHKFITNIFMKKIANKKTRRIYLNTKCKL